MYVDVLPSISRPYTIHISLCKASISLVRHIKCRRCIAQFECRMKCARFTYIEDRTWPLLRKCREYDPHADSPICFYGILRGGYANIKTTLQHITWSICGVKLRILCEVLCNGAVFLTGYGFEINLVCCIV